MSNSQTANTPTEAQFRTTKPSVEIIKPSVEDIVRPSGGLKRSLSPAPHGERMKKARGEDDVYAATHEYVPTNPNFCDAATPECVYMTETQDPHAYYAATPTPRVEEDDE